MYQISFKEAEDRKQEHALGLLRMAERLSHVKSANISWNFSEVSKSIHFKQLDPYLVKINNLFFSL